MAAIKKKTKQNKQKNPKDEKQRNKKLKDVSCFIPFCSEANKGE